MRRVELKDNKKKENRQVSGTGVKKGGLVGGV